MPTGQKRTPSARNRRIFITLVGLLALGLVGVTIRLALRVRQMPAPAPTTTPAPTTPSPTEVASLPSVVNPIILDVRTSVTLPLSAGWQTTDLTVDALRQTVSNRKSSAAQTILSSLGEGARVHIGLLDEASSTGGPISLMVMAVQRDALSLSRYLEDVRAGLQAAGATVHKADLSSALRKDGLPVAVLHYTRQEGGAAGLFDGYQVIAYDATATGFVLFTFTAPSASFAQLLPLFQETVRSADF